jgi:hypothetical protein
MLNANGIMMMVMKASAALMKSRRSISLAERSFGGEDPA